MLEMAPTRQEKQFQIFFWPASGTGLEQVGHKRIWSGFSTGQVSMTNYRFKAPDEGVLVTPLMLIA